MSCSDREITLQIRPDHGLAENNEVILTCDPFAVMKVNVKASRTP
jgi:hypothetical protein